MRMNKKDYFRSIGLAPQQAKVASLVCKGLTNLEIGNKLNLVEETIKFHIGAINKKLKTKNRSSLIILYYEALLKVYDQELLKAGIKSSPPKPPKVASKVSLISGEKYAKR